jgi:uncharacterized membrane protein YsdA (DUF1294 family)
VSRTGANAGSPPGRVTGGQLLFLGLLLVAPGLALFRLDPAILPWLSAGLAGVWVVTALFVWADKRAAQAGAARTPEILLHTCELIGGWPAAFLAQRFWRHKTAKLRYRVTFWLIVLAHECLAADVLLHGRLSRGAWVELRRLLA